MTFLKCQDVRHVSNQTDDLDPSSACPRPFNTAIRQLKLKLWLWTVRVMKDMLTSVFERRLLKSNMSGQDVFQVVGPLGPGQKNKKQRKRLWRCIRRLSTCCLMPAQMLITCSLLFFAGRKTSGSSARNLITVQKQSERDQEDGGNMPSDERVSQGSVCDKSWREFLLVFIVLMVSREISVIFCVIYCWWCWFHPTWRFYPLIPLITWPKDKKD